MTETMDSTTAKAEGSAPAAGDAPKKRGGGLNSMLLADLKSMASGMGIAGAGSMKKAQLVEAIKSAQSKSGGQNKPDQNKSDQNKGGQSDGSQGDRRSKNEQSADRGQDDNRDHQPDNRSRDNRGRDNQDQSRDRRDQQDRNRGQSDGKQSDGKQGGQQQGDQKQGGRDRNQGGQNQGGQNQEGTPAAAAADGAGDATETAIVDARAAAVSAANLTPRSSRTTYSCRRPASLTCSTTTRSSAPAATCPAVRTSTSP